MTLHSNLNTSRFFSRLLVFTCVMMFCLTETFAQLFPVQVTPQLAPPYSVYLSDYATPGTEKLRVIILQRDLTQPAYQLRLVMSIELNGRIIMRTARSFNPRPLSIDPGVPTIVSGSDLAPYLDSRNIDFVGYSREQYEKTRALPEGSYRIIFTAYDYRRQDVQVSNEGSSYYYLSKNEPPMINFPACGTKIQFKDPQQIVFSWLPRNTASPTSAADTEYEFTLFETRPAGRNPNDVVATTQPIFRTRVDIPQLVYGPAEPMLLDGMKYVWRVQAIDRNGKDAFRNNGFSEVCTFTYSTSDQIFDIGVVKNLQAVGETERRAKISWEASNYDGYKVYYKKTSSKEGQYEWFWSNVKTTELKLFDLEPDTEYETRVQVKKNGVFGPYSEIVKFRTLPVRAADCGEQDQPYAKADESKPLLAATKGMIITVDDIDMTLKETIALGGGWFKGTGTVAPKILGKANFYVKFERLYIDENHVAGRGRIDFVTKGVEELVQMQVANQQPKNNRIQWAEVLFQPEIFKYDIEISEVEFEDETFIITGTDGNTSTNNEIYTLLKDAPERAIIIEDKNGEQWVAQKDATTGETKVTKVPGGGLVVGADGRIIDGKTMRRFHRMIKDALVKYKKAIEEYQASLNTKPSKGGGPSLTEEELKLMFAELPVCLVEQKGNFQAILKNIDTYLDFELEKSKRFIFALSAILTPDYPTAEDKDQAPYEIVESDVCKLLGERVATDNIVLIEPIKDQNFIPGIADDKVKIEYSVEVSEDVSNPHGRLEIFLVDGTLAYSTTEIDLKTTGTFEWDGKFNQGNFENRFIRFDESPFLVKISISFERDSSKSIEATATGLVDSELDDWNDNKDMHGWILCEGCSSEQRYRTYEKLKELYSKQFDVLKVVSPLRYFKENITFDSVGIRYTFLGDAIRVHKMFYKHLKDVEEYIKGTYGSEIYDAISVKYSGKVGGFAMRYLNNGSAADTDLSPHGLGLAIDIDPKMNPQIIYKERPLVFFLLKRITGKDFSPGAVKLMADQTKDAHNLFVSVFKNLSVDKLCNPEVYKELRSYSVDATFPLETLDKNTIGMSFDELKNFVMRLKELIPDAGQKDNIKLMTETIDNKIYIIRHDLEKLEGIIKSTFGTIIFSTSGKASIAYFDNIYIKAIKSKLSSLESLNTMVKTELTKHNPFFAGMNFNEFLEFDFNIAEGKVRPFVAEYNSFLSELKSINSVYVDLPTYSTALKSQVNRNDFGNVLLQDGFCDMSDSLLEGILLDAFKKFAEWGGHYDSKKDWMHFGIKGIKNYKDYIY